MSMTVIWNWTRSAQQPASESIATLLQRSRHYRHPDSSQIAYPATLTEPLGKLPAGHYRIAIIGGGAAGISALHELARLVQTLDENSSLAVTLYDSDPEHFLAPSSTSSSARDIHTRNRKAGRVSAARVSSGPPGAQVERTVYEVGAMRFPEIAGLTWHYASQVYSPQAVVQVFPNPGKVTTEFVFADRVDHYINDDWEDPLSPTRSVFALVLKYLVGVLIDDTSTAAGSALFKIGGDDPVVIAGLLKAADTSDDMLKRIGQDWKAFIAEHDHTTLAGAVRAIMTHAAARDELPAFPGLDPASQIDHCVELFARFGFGTGGFKPLYNISLVEMMRLVLWDYSNEYTLPVEENVEFLAGLQRKALETGGQRLRFNFINARVCDAHHYAPADSGTPRHAKVWYYPADDADLHQQDYDYVILAMPQDQLLPLVRRSGYSPGGMPFTQVGDEHLGLAIGTAVQVYPALQLSQTNTAPTARIVSAISQLHMTRSSKVFGLLSAAHSTSLKVPRYKGQPIQAVVSDSGLAASYMVPSTLNDPTYVSLLASYTWDDDSTRLQHRFGHYPQNPQGDVDSAYTMFGHIINRADFDLPGTGQRWWFGELLSNVEDQNRFVFDWTTHGSAGGFKLDMTGDHYQSNRCFRYHTHAGNAALNNRFFLACDSYSHLGGWLEGAFMSGINAVAGVVVAANKGNIESLNREARKLFETLDPIV